jgi:hypothetical protein
MANGFGRFFQNLPGQIMGGMPQVPQQPGMGVPSVMGFPAAPGLPAQAPRKGGGWRQNLDLIGSGLREASGESGQLDAYRKRVAGAGQSEKDAQFRANLPPEQQAVYDVSPEIWAQYFGKPKEQMPLDIVGDSAGGYRAVDRMTGETRRQEMGSPPPAKPGGQWERGPDAWYWVSDDGLTPPRKGPALGAAPKTFAPPRKPTGGGGSNSSGGKPWERY